MTLFSHLVVMLALIAESNRLYARLALSTAARNREREARLMSMDAVAAAISHEVGQPLTAVTTQCDGRPELAHACTAGSRKGDQVAARHHRCRASHHRRHQEHPGDVRQGTGHGHRIQPQRSGARDRVAAGQGAGRREGLAAARARRGAAADPGRSGPDAAGARQPLHQRDRIAGRRRGAGLAALRSARRRWTARTCCSRSAIPASASHPRDGAHLRRLLHDQGDRHRPGPVAVPDHRRGAWRALWASPGEDMARPSTCSCRGSRLPA